MANFKNLLFRASDGTAPITPWTDVLFASGSMPSFRRGLMISGDSGCFRIVSMEIQVDTFQTKHFIPIRQNDYIKNRSTICGLSALSIRSHVRTETCFCNRCAAPAILGQSTQQIFAHFHFSIPHQDNLNLVTHVSFVNELLVHAHFFC